MCAWHSAPINSNPGLKGNVRQAIQLLLFAVLLCAGVQETCAFIPKNRAQEFFSLAAPDARPPAAQVPQREEDSPPQVEKTASGRLFGFVDGPNLYSYVRCNPWTKFDPEGLDATDANPTDYSDAQKKTLLITAENFMETAYARHPGQIGSNNQFAAGSGKKIVHCTTYCVDAIAAGYKAIGMKATAKTIAGMRNASSIKIAGYLKTTLGWSVVYFNPDTANPSYKGEHAVSNRTVMSNGTYYGVPVDGRTVNYDPNLGGSDPAVHTRTGRITCGSSGCRYYGKGSVWNDLRYGRNPQRPIFQWQCLRNSLGCRKLTNGNS